MWTWPLGEVRGTSDAHLKFLVVLLGAPVQIPDVPLLSAISFSLSVLSAVRLG